MAGALRPDTSSGGPPPACALPRRAVADRPSSASSNRRTGRGGSTGRRSTAAEHLHGLVGAGAAFGERHADGVELVRGTRRRRRRPTADPAARPGVQVGELLGHDHRVVQRQQQDGGAHPDPFGPGGQQGEPGDRLAGRPGGRRWPPCQTDSMGSRSAAASQSRSGSGHRRRAEDDAVGRAADAVAVAVAVVRGIAVAWQHGTKIANAHFSRVEVRCRGRDHRDTAGCHRGDRAVLGRGRPRAGWSWSAARPAAPSRSRRAGCAVRAGAGRWSSPRSPAGAWSTASP